MKKHNRRRYTDDFRAGAVVMLESQGYPDVKGALTSTAQHLGIPAMTLHGWYHQKHNPAPTQLLTEKRLDLKELIRNEIYAALEAAPGARDFAEYKELITGAAILLDKLLLLEGKATERIAIEDATSNERRLAELVALYDAVRARTMDGTGPNLIQ